MEAVHGSTVVQEAVIATRDGWQLGARVFHSRNPASRRVLLVAPAIGASRNRYEPFARYMASLGWTTVTFNYRGIEDSTAADPAAPKATLLAWGEEDLAAVIDWAETRLGAEQIAAVLHSISGQLVALAHNHSKLGAVLAVSTPRPFWWLWDGPYRFAIWAFFRVFIPATVSILGYLPMRLASLHDLPEGVALDWSRMSLSLDDRDAMRRRLLERFSDYRTRTFVLSFEDDSYIAPRKTVDQLVETFYARASTERRHVVPAEYGLGPIGHSGFFDGQVPRSWWAAASTWLEKAS